MSFTRVGPFSFGSKFTSAQANILDANLANALDKSVAGDQMLGAITMAPAASITASNAQNIAVSAAGALKTTAAGGIQLGGGSTDYPTFSSPRTRNIVVPFIAGAFATSGTIQTSYLYIATTTASITSTLTDIFLPLRGVHNGAVLESCLISFAVGQAHSGVPQFLPSACLQRVKNDGSGYANLLSTGFSPCATPGSGSAWFDGGAVQGLVLLTDQNNVIDTTLYSYMLAVVDESGTNALNGNVWYSVQLSFSSINDMRFQ